MIPAAVTSFIGRRAILEESKRLLSGARLVSLVGPGGVGKTRLVLELARTVEADYDMIAVADLVEHAGAAAIERSLVSTLSIVDHSNRPAMDTLIEYLRAKRALLVLDNCEHQWEAVSDLATTLLKEAPQLSLVATSRRHLEVSGEHVLRVPPLAVPRPGTDREQAVQSEAMILLLDRAAAAGRPMVEDDDWNAIAELARWSGGLPLVLEHIAVRMGSGMSPAAILRRLDGGRLLRAEGRRVQSRHRALWQVFDWSYGLCSVGEQRLWERLSVFPGEFDLKMAEEVCGDADGIVATSTVLDLLAGLVKQSVVIAGTDDRFRQLQPIREYGLHRLRSLGEEEMMRDRHCTFVRRLIADAQEVRFGPGELDLLRQVHRELPNIRAALSYCSTPERAQTGLSIATDITSLSSAFFAVFLEEFCARVETFLTLTPPTPSADRVGALAMLAIMCLWQGDHDRATAHRQECVDQARRLGATDVELPVLPLLQGMYLFLARNDPSCLESLARARDAFTAQNAVADAHKARIWLAIAAGFLGSEEFAEQAVAEALEDAETNGGPWSTSWALWAKGRAERSRPQNAVALLQEALRMLVDMGDQPWGASLCVESIAWEWAAQELAIPAAQLLGGVAGIQRRAGVLTAGPGPFHRERENAVSLMRATLGDEPYAKAFRQGSMLSSEEIYALALRSDFTDDKTTNDARDLPLDALTTRQQQIAQLVSHGLSNKEIAAELHISRRTVENHLGQIFVRLDVHNRAQVAAWVTREESIN